MGKLPQNHLAESQQRLVRQAVRLYYPNIGTKKDPIRGLVFVINKRQIVGFILPFRFGMFGPLNP